MKVTVMCNSNTFQILEAVDCPEEFKASNGWKIYNERDDYTMKDHFQTVCLKGRDDFSDSGMGDIAKALTALHEMVYQQPVFSDDGSIVMMEHGKFRIEEWSGGQIVFQVLEMDEEFRCDKFHNTYATKNGMFVRSLGNLTMNGTDIYLRGTSKLHDLSISICEHGVARPQIISALRDWDQNWPGWTRKTPTLEQCRKYGSLETGGVFVFDSEVGK